MNTNRPITDYEVEYIEETSHSMTYGKKYPILSETPPKGCWVIKCDNGKEVIRLKTRFSAPTLRPECNILQSKQDYEVFANAIATPAPPNDALKQAQAKYMKAMCIVNPDIDLLDKFAMAALSGCISQYSNIEIRCKQAYIYAHAMMDARKQYLTLNIPDNG